MDFSRFVSFILLYYEETGILLLKPLPNVWKPLWLKRLTTWQKVVIVAFS